MDSISEHLSRLLAPAARAGAPAPGPRPREPGAAATRLLTATHPGREPGRRYVLFQPFSDMRILSTITLLPGFDLYVMLAHAASPCAPMADAPGVEELPAALRGLCSCVRLAPVLMMGLQCLGFEVRAASAAYPNGRAAYAGDRRPAHALRLDFARPGGATQHILHACLDTSDEGLHGCPEFLDFMHALPSLVTLVRGASGTLGSGGFSTLESLVTTRSAAIVEDDACLPYASLRKAGYYVRMHESWTRVIVELCAHLPPWLDAAAVAAPALSPGR